MSHFTVTVRLTAERIAKHDLDLDAALREVMAPYQENNMGTCAEQFMVFNEDEECDVDAKTGKRGYWENPNAKWDWFLIGGRWRGFFPVKAGVRKIIGPGGSLDNPPDGGSDVVRVSDIDMDAVAIKQRSDMVTFKAKYRALLAGKEFSWDDPPRERAVRLGLIRIEEDPKAAVDPDAIVMPWSRVPHLKDDPRNVWRDVCVNPTDEGFLAYCAAFNPLKTYAALDDSGWHAPGTMGWWGCSSDEPDSYMAFANGFLEKFIKPVGPDDLLVLVDCHI